ncbi:enoyl-CoA hydratase/isomerase family protein [Rhodococcus koreensis]|uniref:Enoyl-CoA hydratase n=1 Tax=Rhodococcus koreensis TaxID=99653 RepID=A0A1H4KXF9_9NOCA|nr:enoyl-CoA hydratase/isomerase family protein [Rhodococcus koreensis]SEB63103.1 enoyl-CoA hydratase [Rhodococcus koreensis]
MTQVYGDLGQLEITNENGIFTIEIGGLDGPTHAALGKVFRIAHESDANVVVVTGKDRTFLNPKMYDQEWLHSHAGNIERSLLTLKETDDLNRDLIACEKVTIAKVYAPGAHSLGAAIALGCDFVVAADDATFSDPHMAKWGSPPGDGGSVVWPLRIGLGRAREFLLLDRVCTAKEGVEMGLIDRAVPADQVEAEVDTMVQKLLSYNQFSLRSAKKWLNNYVLHAQMMVGTGALFAEGMAGRVQSAQNITQNFDEYGKELKERNYGA